MQTAARPRLLMMNHLLSSLRRSTLKISPSSPSLLSPVFSAPIQSTHKRLFSDASHVSTSSTKSTSSDPTPSPPSVAENVREIPFMIERTRSKMLPVYTDYRNAGSRKLTIVRKYKGDSKALVKELQLLCGADAFITERPGRIEVKGIHSAKIKAWFTHLGF